jgi:1-acyl-sn-glycerol-3-phosphate acyltransferase
MIARLPRTAAHGLMFALFGVASVLLAGVIIPVTVKILVAFKRVTIGRSSAADETTAGHNVAQSMIHHLFRAYVWLGTLLGVWRVEATGLERLRAGPVLVIANHPSLLDVVFLLSFIPQGDCVVKGEAWRNPALGGMMRAAGYIPNDVGETTIEQCMERVAAGRTVVLFPEGSRSPDVGLGPMKRGAAHVALRSGCTLLPVTIDLDPPTLKRGQAWYKLPNRKFLYSFAVGEPTVAKDLVEADLAPSLAARRINSWIREYFETRLEAAAAARLENGIS